MRYTNPTADAEYSQLLENPEKFPFSFVYNGEKINGFPKELFTLREKSTDNGTDVETTTLVFDFDASLTVKLLVTHYFSHGATEWTLNFENNSDKNSGVISDVLFVQKFKGHTPMLRGNLGDHENQYRPYGYDLSDAPADFVSDTGRATHIVFPYFNLEYGDGGALLAIGWAGTWAANFYADGEDTFYRARSVNNLNTYLKPGEKIRTALFVCIPYTVRDKDYATNLWRSWFIRYNLPKADGNNNPLKPFSTTCFFSDTGLPNSDGSISERYDTWKPSFDKMIAEDVKVDFRWFDAGWYVRPDLTGCVPYSKEKDWWPSVGTWTLDPEKWPDGTFLESTEYARKNGMKTLMWFEPERTSDPENLEKNFGYKREWAISVDGVEGIANNIGNPDCYRWTVDRICKTLRENKVEMYREDNNFKSAKLWEHLDGVEGDSRLGITECKFIGAHYRMWDEIIACTTSYGGCAFVDSCASGGGRNDLESMRRGVPLLRSDSDRTVTSLRLSMTSTFNKWIPFCGACSDEKNFSLSPVGANDVYIWRASYLPALNVYSQYAQAPDKDFSIIRNGIKEWKRVSPYLLGDYYVHTPWHSKNDKTGFTAFSFIDPEEHGGVILAFRQEECERESLVLKLSYANKNASYVLTDEDTKNTTEYTGEQLQNGIKLDFDAPRSSRLIWIEKR